MNDSFNATVAYGRLALAMLFVANLAAYLQGESVAGMVFAIAGTGAAYVSQGLFHRAEADPASLMLGYGWQLVSLFLAMLSGGCVLV